jgi:hypothetical protein
LLPLPAPRCELGRARCDRIWDLGTPCADGASYCDSIEEYSARIFGLLSQDRDDRAGVLWINHYTQNVKIEEYSDDIFRIKRWTLPMLNSIDQAYAVAQRFFGQCWRLDTYDPPRKVDIAACSEIANANIVLSVDDEGAVVDWGVMD